MKKYKVLKKYRIDNGERWVQKAEPDEIEVFEAKTERAAIAFFRHKYASNIKVCAKDFFMKKEINTYALYTCPKKGRAPRHIDTEIIYTKIKKEK